MANSLTRQYTHTLHILGRNSTFDVYMFLTKIGLKEASISDTEVCLEATIKLPTFKQFQPKYGTDLLDHFWYRNRQHKDWGILTPRWGQLIWDGRYRRGSAVFTGPTWTAAIAKADNAFNSLRSSMDQRQTTLANAGNFV